MTPKELDQSQKVIDGKVYNLAQKKKLIGDYEPIYDGVCDAADYLNSNLKILWVLKEPYCEDGDYGGWSLTKDVFSEYPYKRKITNQTHQNVAYISYGILHNKKFEDIDYIRDDPSVGEVLHEIAWINISKIPAGTTTNDNTLWEKYETWKNILLEQINLYEPDIIIFGNTFEYFKNDLISDKAVCDTDYSRQISHTGNRVDLYWTNEQLFIDTNHPNFRGEKCEWADAIIEAVGKYFWRIYEK